MTCWRFPDDLGDESRLEGLVQLALDRRDFPGYPYDVVRALLLAGYADACSKVAKSQRDHWAGRATLRRYMSDVVIEALARPLSEDEPGLLHRHGEVCHCLSDHEARWPSYIEFAVHDFLRTNPSRAERSLHDLKKKEIPQLRQEALRQWWYACAYCRRRPDTLNDHVSPRSLTLDHVDPHTPGAVVIACKGCNAAKGARTADEWGQRLRFRPDRPALDWADALANGADAFTEADAAAVPIVMAGHGAPPASAPTPRPRTQADPYMRSRVPTGGSDPDPDPAPDPGPDPAPDPAPDPGRDRLGPGYGPGSQPAPLPGTEPGPEPARNPATEPVHDPPRQPRTEPHPEGLGREGKGQPGLAATADRGPPKNTWLGSGKPVTPIRTCNWCTGPIASERQGVMCSQKCIDEYAQG